MRGQTAKHPFLRQKELANRGEEKRTDPIYCRCHFRMTTNLSGLVHLLQKVKFVNAAVEGERGAAQGVEAQLLQSAEATPFEASLDEDT